MLQGLSNRVSFFQIVMDRILSELQYETVIVYLGALVVFGSNYDEHLQRLEEVLRRLRKANLELSPSNAIS